METKAAKAAAKAPTGALAASSSMEAPAPAVPETKAAKAAAEAPAGASAPSTRGSDQQDERIATLERQITLLSQQIKLLASLSKDHTARIERLETRDVPF